LFDGETGLHYNYLRDYDPEVGRYAESDPLGLETGLSTFGYVFQNPLSSTDPLGLGIFPRRMTKEEVVEKGKEIACDFAGDCRELAKRLIKLCGARVLAGCKEGVNAVSIECQSDPSKWFRHCKRNACEDEFDFSNFG